MEFSCNFTENVAKRRKTQISYAWLLLLTFLASVFVVLNELMAVKRSLSAAGVRFKFNNRSSLEFQ